MDGATAASSADPRAEMPAAAAAAATAATARDLDIEQLEQQREQLDKASVSQLQQRAQALGLSSRGVDAVLRRRLRHYYNVLLAKIAGDRPMPKPKSKRRSAGGPAEEELRFVCVVDVEATCMDVRWQAFPHEIIEWPMVLLDRATGETVAEFQAHVKPVFNPRLSAFCTQLTGITQEMVDLAEPWPQVLETSLNWLEAHEATADNCIIATDGPWDLRDFFHFQCKISEIKVPTMMRQWLNVRKCFAHYYNLPMCNLNSMLAALGRKFEGREHCGLDDARNIAGIVSQLIHDGAYMVANEAYREFKPKHLRLTDVRQYRIEELQVDGSAGAASSSASLSAPVKLETTTTTTKIQVAIDPETTAPG